MKLSIPLVACALAFLSPAQGANRYFFEDQTVPPGAEDVELFLHAETDQTIFGFSFGVNYDESALAVMTVTWEGTSIANQPDFFDGNNDSENGLIGFGCVFDFTVPFPNALLAAADHRIAKIVVDVIGAPGTSSDLVLEAVLSNPGSVRPVNNVIAVMSDGGATSILPELVNGTVTIEDRTPVINSISANEGSAGAVFEVAGEFLGEAGLEVKVCGAVAAAVLRGDGVTLDVTAPECAATGFALLEVCTVHGCDTEAQGFNYVDGGGGLQRPSDCNQDGRLNLADAICLLGHLFLGSPPTLPCEGGTVNDPGNQALVDSNGDTLVNLADAVGVLLFLFSGGPPHPLGTSCVPMEGCPAACE
ncbi:MAG TPA: hypothetical protein VMT52_01120 [Planctomycetota bacterium]|nr:hypothetical protein [Planctomycetota bacterium]